MSANGQLQSPVQTYFVPLPEDSLFESFKRIASTASGDIETTISIAVAANKTIIYYDHHEDGYDFTFLGDVSTRQSSTQIWGDNNPSNGIPPGYTEDVLMGGSTILLKNQVPVGGTRGETILYDGRDRILATLPIAVTRSAFPGSPGGLLAGAVEVFNRDSWGQEYVAPVGNSTDHPSDTDPFSKYTIRDQLCTVFYWMLILCTVFVCTVCIFTHRLTYYSSSLPLSSLLFLLYHGRL